MPANTAPIFTLTPNVGRAVVGASANTNGLGTGTIATDIMLVFTAGANGSWLSKVRFHPAASAAATATTATTLRVFVSTAASGATTGGTNVWLIGEISAAAQTADHSTSATNPLEFPLNFAIPTGQTILVASHVVNSANTAWHATCFGGDY